MGIQRSRQLEPRPDPQIAALGGELVDQVAAAPVAFLANDV
jgi:hypothetical protein